VVANCTIGNKTNCAAVAAAFLSFGATVVLALLAWITLVASIKPEFRWTPEILQREGRSDRLVGLKISQVAGRPHELSSIVLLGCSGFWTSGTYSSRSFEGKEYQVTKINDFESKLGEEFVNFINAGHCYADGRRTLSDLELDIGYTIKVLVGIVKVHRVQKRIDFKSNPV